MPHDEYQEEVYDDEDYYNCLKTICLASVIT